MSIDTTATLKTITRSRRDCWRRGNEAIQKENWDYAIQMYFTAVKLLSRQSHLPAVAAVCRVQEVQQQRHRRYDGRRCVRWVRRGRSRSAGCRRTGPALDVAAEEGLQVNPWDLGFNTDVGDAAKALGYPEVAMFAYEEVLKKDPGNKEVNKSLALVLEERGEYKRASDCWRRILKQEPTNGEARSKITALDTKGVMDRGGYEGADSTRGVMAARTKSPAVWGETARGGRETRRWPIWNARCAKIRRTKTTC